MTTLQWFTCLFAYNFNFEVLQRLWDLIFIKGNKIMFRIALAIFHLLEQPLLQCQGIQDVLSVMETTSQLLQDPNMVLSIANKPQYRIKKSYIDRMRKLLKADIIEEIEKYRVKPNQKFSMITAIDHNTGSKFSVSQFLTKVPLFKGIQQFYLEEQENNP